MSNVTREKITAPAAWVGPEIADDPSWVLTLDNRAIEEIDAALSAVKRAGLAIPFGKEDFPLPTFSATIDTIPDRLEEGLGFVQLRGLPRERYSDTDCELIYWGIGKHLGNPVSQNRRGHVLGHVRDEGRKLSDPNTRPYQTSLKLDFHSDQLPVDMVGLFCCRTAKKGGASFLVSALTVHNVIRDERPDLLEVLYQPFNLDWRGEEPVDSQPWFTCPMFSLCDGKVTSRVAGRIFFESVTRWGEDLAMTDIQRQAVDLLQEVAERPELRLSIDFQEGDMQFINNHMILHARAEYEDYEEPERKRHLLRMWIGLPPERRRQLAPELQDRLRIVDAGGIPIKTAA